MRGLTKMFCKSTGPSDSESRSTSVERDSVSLGVWVGDVDKRNLLVVIAQVLGCAVRACRNLLVVIAQVLRCAGELGCFANQQPERLGESLYKCRARLRLALFGDARLN
jgi:hypothetical protein